MRSHARGLAVVFFGVPRASAPDRTPRAGRAGDKLQDSQLVACPLSSRQILSYRSSTPGLMPMGMQDLFSLPYVFFLEHPGSMALGDGD